MRLGLALSITTPPPGPGYFAAVGALVSPASTVAGTLTHTAAFDPTSLALTGYWRASYAGSPWVGTASAGTSSAQDAVTMIGAPDVGATVNGYAPADFDGVTDSLTVDDTLDTYAGALMLCGWALVYLDNAAGSIISSNSALTFFVVATGGTIQFDLNSSGTSVSRAVSTGAWVLVTFRYNGTNAQVGVNEAPGAAGGGSTAAYSTNLSPLTDTVHMGVDMGVGFFDGKVLEWALSDANITDGNYADIKAYCNTRYALAL